jgi:hypothetical protein
MFEKIGKTISSVFNGIIGFITRPITSTVSNTATAVAKPLTNWILALAALGIVLIFLINTGKKTKIGSQFL